MAETVPRTHAARVCGPCRLGKRGCDKLLPTCSYCQQVRRPCYYDVDLSSTGDSKLTSRARLCPLPSGMRDVSSLSIREHQPLPFMWKESRHYFRDDSDDKLILQGAKPRRLRKRRRQVTVCQRCRYLKKKCDRWLPSCSYCQKARLSCNYDIEELSEDVVSSQHSFVAKIMQEVSSGMLNPFQTYPVQFPIDLIDRCSRYRLSTIAPILTPSRSGSTAVPAVQYWFSLSLHDPTLFTATLFAALSHQRTRWLMKDKTEGFFLQQDQKWLALFYLEAIRMISKSLQDPGNATTDTITLSVLILAELATTEEHALEMIQSKDSPFDAPFQSMQWIDVYSSLPPNQIHLDGLIKIIELKGGLENVRLPCLAAILSLFDLIHSTRWLSHPRFPFISLQGITSPKMSDLLGFGPSAIPRSLNQYHLAGFTKELAETLHAMEIYISMLDRYQRGALKNLDLSLIADQRNIIQHHVISLPTAAEIKEVFAVNVKGVYEVCRIAALIFSMGVIFPLQKLCTAYRPLVKQLKLELQELRDTIDIYQPQELDLVIWATTLGAIAAKKTPERSWFVYVLKHLTEYSGLSRWDDLKERLERILWLRNACNAAGYQLWLEVQDADNNECT